MLRHIIIAAAVLATGPANAFCVPTAEFRGVLAGWGESVRYAGLSLHGGEPTPVYVAVADDGNWTVFFVSGSAVACLLATGTDWSEPDGARPGKAGAGE